MCNNYLPQFPKTILKVVPDLLLYQFIAKYLYGAGDVTVIILGAKRDFKAVIAVRLNPT